MGQKYLIILLILITQLYKINNYKIFLIYVIFNLHLYRQQILLILDIQLIKVKVIQTIPQTNVDKCNYKIQNQCPQGIYSSTKQALLNLLSLQIMSKIQTQQDWSFQSALFKLKEQYKLFKVLHN
ncbi:transmembrane protein, putative (macronuclear) [Tetrahymena thermophila SB210]|uniref:Transmembrane protein, putative n=1 Tax=Tetrahymena thermophila (strain SB210) TaxID=312017 RepID=W7X7T4_TETTS|nr:transmembrane protein, putative [Tetrahymena thermophila SB210]EWS73402.1 transmembrane protein, putative [Tetrahymena thermophila SB210]|eukprot:XP_012654054.1 transmembrane protein, putative [Tetrahymena thermophila SB210]